MVVDGKDMKEKGWQKEFDKREKKRNKRRVLDDSDYSRSNCSSSSSSIGKREDFEHDTIQRTIARRAMVPMSVSSSDDEKEIVEIEHDDDENHLLRPPPLINKLSDDNDEEALETALGPFDRSVFLMPEGERAAMGLPSDIPNYLNEGSDSILVASELKKKIEWLSNDGLLNFEKALRKLKSRIWSMRPNEAREEILSLKTFGLHRLIRGGIDIAKWCYRTLDSRNDHLDHKYKRELQVADLRLDPLDSRIDERLHELRNLERSYGNSLDCTFEIEEIDEDNEREEGDEVDYEVDRTSTILLDHSAAAEDGTPTRYGSRVFEVVKKPENHGTNDDSMKGGVSSLPLNKELRIRGGTRAVKKRRWLEECKTGVRVHSLLTTGGVQQCEKNKKTKECYEPFKPFHVRYEERQQKAAAAAMALHSRKAKKRGLGWRIMKRQNKRRDQGHGTATTLTGDGASERKRQQSMVFRHVGGGTLTPKSSRCGIDEGLLLLSDEERQGGKTQQLKVQARYEQRQQQMHRPSQSRNPTCLSNLRSLVEDLVSLPTPTNRHSPSIDTKPTTKSSSSCHDTVKEEVIEPKIWNEDFISAFERGTTIILDCIYTQTLNDRIADLSAIALTLEGCKQGLVVERNLRNDPGALPFRRFIHHKDGSGLVLYQSDSNSNDMATTSHGISFNSTIQTGQDLLSVPEEQIPEICGGHVVPEVIMLVSQVVDHDDVLSDVDTVRACCSAMAVLSHVPMCKRVECGFIDGVRYLAERTLRDGGLERALMQLDEKKQKHEAELLSDAKEQYKRTHECRILEFQCAVRCRLLEWLQVISGDGGFKKFSRDLLLELLDLYERFPRSVAIIPVKVWEEDKIRDSSNLRSPSSSLVIWSPIINLWCRLLCSVDNYVLDDHCHSSFWVLFNETIIGANVNMENTRSMPSESVWSVVIFVTRLYILIGNTSNDNTPMQVYNPDFWRLVLLLLQAGPLSVGPPGIRKGKEVGRGRVTFTSPPESAFPLTYSCIQLERILVLSRYCPPSVGELSCIFTASIKLSSDETLWGAEGSTSGSTPYSARETSFNDHLASIVVDLIVNMDSDDVQYHENKVTKVKPLSLLQKLLQHCRHALHLSVMVPTSQCCCINGNSSPSSAFHPSLRLCGMAMEVYRQQLALESPGLNRRRLHSSLLRTLGELKSRNKAAAFRGSLCLVMATLRGNLLKGGVGEATELLYTPSIGLQPDRRVMLMVPPAMEIFSLLQENPLQPSNKRECLQLCKAVAGYLGELTDLFACSGVEGRLLDRPRAAVAVCSCCLYLMATCTFTGGSKDLLRVMIPPIGLMLGHLNCLGISAGKAVVGVAEHCAKVLWGGGVTFDKIQEGNITLKDKPTTSMLHVEDEFGELGVDPTLLDLLEGSCLPQSSSTSNVEVEKDHLSQSVWLSDANLLSLHFLGPIHQRLVLEGKGKCHVPPNYHPEIQQSHVSGAPGWSDTTTKLVDWSDVPLLRLQGIVSAAACASVNTTETAATSTVLSNISPPSFGVGNTPSSLLGLHIDHLQLHHQQQQSQYLGAHCSSLKLLGDYFQHQVSHLSSVGFFMCVLQAATVPEKSETCSSLFKSIYRHCEWLLLTVWVETALDPLTFPPVASGANEVKLCGRAFTRGNVASRTISDSERTFFTFIRDGLIPLAHNLEHAFMETSPELQGIFNARTTACGSQLPKYNEGIRGETMMHEQAQAKSEEVALERASYLASVVRHLAQLWGRAKELAKGGQGAEAQCIKLCVVQVVRSSLHAMCRGVFQWQEQSDIIGGCDTCSHYSCIIHAHLCYSYMGMVARSLPEALKGPPLLEMVGSLFGSLVSSPEGAQTSSTNTTTPYKQQYRCTPTPNHLIPVSLHYLPDLLACFAQLQYNSRPISDWLAALSYRSIQWGVGHSRNSHGKELRRSFAAGLGGWKFLQQQPTHNSISVGFRTSLENIVSEIVPNVMRIHQMRRSFMQHLDLPTALLEECEHIAQSHAGGCIPSSEVVVPVLHRSLLFLGLLFNSLGRGKVGVDDRELLQEAAPLLVPLYFIIRLQGLHGSHTAAALRAAVRILDTKEMGVMNRNLASIAAMQQQTQNEGNGEENMSAPLCLLVLSFARALAILVSSCFERDVESSSAVLKLREVEENRFKEAATVVGMRIPNGRINNEKCFGNVCNTSSVAWEEGTWHTSAELLCSVLVASAYQDVRQRLKNSLKNAKAVNSSLEPKSVNSDTA